MLTHQLEGGSSFIAPSGSYSEALYQSLWDLEGTWVPHADVDPEGHRLHRDKPFFLPTPL